MCIRDSAYKGGGGVGDLNEVHRMETFDMDATNGFLDRKWYHLYCSVQRLSLIHIWLSVK